MSCPYCNSLKTRFVRILDKEEVWLCDNCNAEFFKPLGNTGY